MEAVAYWVISDHFEELGRPPRLFHNGFGLLTVGNLRKPRYWAVHLAAHQGDDVLATDVTGDGADVLVRAWATKHDDGTVDVLHVERHDQRRADGRRPAPRPRRRASRRRARRRRRTAPASPASTRTTRTSSTASRPTSTGRTRSNGSSCTLPTGSTKSRCPTPRRPARPPVSASRSPCPASPGCGSSRRRRRVREQEGSR